MVGWVVFGLAVVAVSYVGNLVGFGSSPFQREMESVQLRVEI